jgi:hypothetical protein
LPAAVRFATANNNKKRGAKGMATLRVFYFPMAFYKITTQWLALSQR